MFNNLDMNELMKKAKEVQETLEKKKKEAAGKTIEASVGGGMIKVTMNGNMEALSVSVDPEVVNKDEIDILEDLIRSAMNEAIRQTKEISSPNLSDMVSGMNIPNLGDMFK